MPQVFLSYSTSDSTIVEGIRELLECVFGNQVDFFQYEAQFKGGEKIKSELEERIKNSEMLLLFMSSSFNRSMVKWEYEVANEYQKKVIGVKIDKKLTTEAIGDFAQGLAELNYIDLSQLGQNPKMIMNLVEKIREIRESALHSKSYFLSTPEDLGRDLERTCRKSLDMFLIDGGSTLKSIFGNSSRAKIMNAKLENVRVLFVDTNFKELVSSSELLWAFNESEQNQIRKAMDDIAPQHYSYIYEALLYESKGIHNRGVHQRDLNLTEKLLSKSIPDVNIEIRMTSVLPLFRMILNEDYLYRTHCLLSKFGVHDQIPLYHTLAIKNGTEEYEAGREYFSWLFDNAKTV